MNAIQIIAGVVLFIISIFLICVVLLQEGKNPGLGALTGSSSDTFYSKNKGKTKEATLAKVTKISAVVFLLITLALDVVLQLAAK